MSIPGNYNRWLHRFAVLTACVALLPVVVGALVTTLEAGMAFADWPTSDGHGMLAYPWLSSVGDQFIEHGHRLAGMMIGVFAIGLCVFVWAAEHRRWVRVLGTLVLLGVIAQGLLGGLRVLQNDDRLAMLHGNLAAWVVALIGIVALVTGRRWTENVGVDTGATANRLKSLAVVTPIVIMGQYILGGAVRHLGTALHEHLAFAAIVLIVVIWSAVVAWRTGSQWLRFGAVMMLLMLVAQIGLGAASWVTKFGFAPVGYVAVQHSPVQVVVRSAHTVVGMLLFMTAVLQATRVLRLASFAANVAPGKRPIAALSGQGGVG